MSGFLEFIATVGVISAFTVTTAFLITLPVWFGDFWEWLTRAFKKLTSFIAGIANKRFNKKDEKPLNLSEMQTLNQLGKCDKCDRYTRKHILELNRMKSCLEEGEINSLLRCPNCNSTLLAAVEESHEWQKTHRHCYKMNTEQYKEFMVVVDDVVRQINRIKDFKALEEYESKHLANDPKFNADRHDKQ